MDLPEKRPLTARLTEPAIVLEGDTGVYKINGLVLSIDEALHLYNQLGAALALRQNDD